MTSLAEENYLKAIYTLQEKNATNVSTSALAECLTVSAASVTDFVKKMSVKKLIAYEKSKGVILTEKGKKIALGIIRKHRLWEVWLVEKLGFKWDEVHAIAEQLEHVVSDDLITQLDRHLGHPTTDPHGDLIPNAEGKFAKNTSKPLVNYAVNDTVKFIGVAEHSTSFLQYLTKSNIALGDIFTVESIEDFDQSYIVTINKNVRKDLSREVVKNLLVIKL
jgi:DtxR family transcriptional regulator, Mn-dependent transcriptional regulator